MNDRQVALAPEPHPSEYEALLDILYGALLRYDREAARLRRDRAFRRAIHVDGGPTIKRGSRRAALASYLAGEVLRQRGEYGIAIVAEETR